MIEELFFGTKVGVAYLLIYSIDVLEINFLDWIHGDRASFYKNTVTSFGHLL